MSTRGRPAGVRLARGVAVAVLAAGAALSGCGAGDRVTERATEKIVEKGIESGASGDVDVDLDGDRIRVESSDGSFAMGGDVPADFPAEVPLADGEVLMSSSTPDGWSVILEVDGAFDEVSRVALDAVVQAGFTEENRTTSAEYVALVAGDDRYDVMLTAMPGDGGGTTLSYAVSRAG